MKETRSTIEHETAYQRLQMPRADGYTSPAGQDVTRSWPPVGRGPTDQELADSVAIVHEDGSVSWSPTDADFEAAESCW